MGSMDGGRHIRTALVVGVGLTVGVWLFVGYNFSRRMATLDARSTAISARYLDAQERLSTARTQILVSSLSVRDALLDESRPPARDYRRELAMAYDVAEEALAGYVSVLEPSFERERVAELRGQLKELRIANEHVLSAEGPRLPSDAGRVLRTQIMPRREAAVGLADDLQALNRTVFVQHQTEVTEFYRRAQRQLWQALGIALATSLAIALVVAAYARRLEDRIARQRAKELQTKDDLQRLSASLVHAQEEERRTIARELHDEVGQVLTAIKVELSVAQRAIESAGGSAAPLEDVRTIADRAMHTVRDLSHLLHPPLLDDLGLPAAIDWYIKGFRKRHGIKVDFHHAPPVGRLPRETAVAAYRILQEALTNVVKHAQATHCRVELGQGLDGLRLVIEDDGVGFDMRALDRGERPRGLGLVGIRERAQQLTGTVRIDSVPGKGTRLVAELPDVPRRDAAESSESVPMIEAAS